MKSFYLEQDIGLFVLDNDVKAIMLRVPANVTGDGKHTVEELVAAKKAIHCGGPITVHH